VSARLFVGTSGYVYGHWRSVFYPRSLPLRGWLPFYAQRFDTVELNSSFYRLPSAAAFRAWRAVVPEHFVFAVKASRFLTHLKRLRAPARPLALFLRRARWLDAKLGPVLVQLPERFDVDHARLDHFLRVLRRHAPRLRVALELRHPSWLVDDTYALLARANVALCLHDWRRCPVAGPLTADFVYLRRHGTTKRYAGSYTDRMLRADARRARAWLRGGRDVYVYFNNDGGGAAVKNALRLRRLLRSVAGPAARSAARGALAA
jgi:uncharacterized protein YecE (DUF72 family)